MSVYANEGFYALGGFAIVVGAIDGSLVPIAAPINASVHPPHVRFSFVFVAFGQSVNFIFNSNSDALHHAAVALSHISDLIWLVMTLANNSLLPTAKSSKTSANLHSYYYICHYSQL